MGEGEEMNDLPTIILIAFPYLAAVVLYFVGRRDGRADRNINLEGQGAKEAFAYLLRHELHRHREDIAHIKKDMKTLEIAGIRAPDIPLGLWIEVNRGS